MNPYEREQKKLKKRLASAPLVTLSGVVDAGGAAGGKAQWERQWSVLFAFDAWRIDGGPVQTTPLRLSRTVTREELKRLMSRIRPYSLLRVRARVLRKTAEGPMAVMTQLVGPDRSDKELKAHATRLKEPVTFEDRRFGTLTLDRRFDQYTGKTTWDRRPVELHLQATTQSDVAAALKTAHTLWKSQARWAKRTTDLVAKELLPVKNRIDEGEEILSAPEFRRRMTLQTVLVFPDGNLEFWYEDGGMFGWHSIVVRGNLRGGPTSAAIE